MQGQGGGQKRTKFQREADYAVITELYLKSKTQTEIAAHLAEIRSYSITQQTVSRDLKTIQKRWRTDTTIDLDEARQRELARIDQLEREYWQAWEKSKQPRKRVSQTDKTVSRQTEERTGDPRYLAGVQWCIQQRCKLLDIEAPQRQQVQLEDEHGVFKTLLSVLHRKDDEGETG